MGLCKCPKKKVTSLFCFEHRVNVCEHCLVTNHQRCIVQSYLQWLQDSEYDPSCKLCNQPLDSSGQCIRLMCYDVFHWSCLDEFARSLPSTTAPAGFCCPSCRSSIFPASNVVSPVADSLKQRLSDVNWARAGLGLHLIPATEEKIPAKKTSTNVNIEEVNQYTTNSISNPVARVQESSTYARPDKVDLSYIKEVIKDERIDDHDKDKYKRRPAVQWFSRWFRSRIPSVKTKNTSTRSTKKCIVLILLIMFGFISVISIMYHLGRNTEDDLDPFEDNPNLRVVQNHE